MKIIKTIDNDFFEKFDEVLGRGSMDLDNVSSTVNSIINEIKTDGDKALYTHIEKFDAWKPLSTDDLLIDTKDMKEAYENLDTHLKEALHTAYRRIYSYHEKQLPKSWMSYEDNGNVLGQKVTPVKNAGLYIPGGKAAYPSSLLMNAIPAIVAGVKNIVVCTPTPKNEVNSLLLAALHICGISRAFKVGGASAIAAMAYGTDSIPKVDVITGPGNIYVACAKKAVFGEVNIDMVAGPSEIAIIADESANPEFLAIDLLSQAEHDEMASSILVTTSEELANKTKDEVYKRLETLKRKDIARKSIENRGVIIITQTPMQIIDIVNSLAPEHLELAIANPFDMLPFIDNAGAIFMGHNTPEAIGDYIAGPNHTLPTGGTARFFSPLGVENFMKKSSVIHMSYMGLSELGNKCALMADKEDLEAHKLSVLERLK
ncbi:MAG: Histidinol dehydrogenase (EC [uncultured Campylobacterales bacterium]|uniref:Histidinol dehydrogenase n=1 Tax=uncultured Campylobacterales bacterium TaxID=352960 RepID=A0A6S6STF1_9BACT|nr:MAG: Histidinol dehydrogenase (EC [uncultured Campylobacterales bacterium]